MGQALAKIRQAAANCRRSSLEQELRAAASPSTRAVRQPQEFGPATCLSSLERQRHPVLAQAAGPAGFFGHDLQKGRLSSTETWRSAGLVQGLLYKRAAHESRGGQRRRSSGAEQSEAWLYSGRSCRSFTSSHY